MLSRVIISLLALHTLCCIPSEHGTGWEHHCWANTTLKPAVAALTQGSQGVVDTLQGGTGPVLDGATVCWT